MDKFIFDLQRFVYINNTASNTLLSGTSGDDKIKNGGWWDGSSHDGGSNVTINTGAGNDYVDNSGNSVKIDTGTGNDSVYNFYSDGVTINTGAGNDYVYNDGLNVTINTGDGNDYVINYGNSVKIDTGTGNDSVHSWGDSVTINTGAGDDEIFNNCYEDDGSIYYYDDGYGKNVVFQYSSGDGNDIIYGFKEDSTLQIGGTYSTQTSGSDIIVTVGDGKITLVGAASLSAVNIAGTYSNINIIENSTSSTMISGTSYADSISNYGSNVTISGNSGNDSIYNNWNFSYDSPYDDSDGSNVLFKYYSDEGEDIIYGFKENSTLQINDGYGDYYTYQSGSDIIVTVVDEEYEDEYNITLVGAASLSSVNIDGYYYDEEYDDEDDEDEVYSIVNRTSSTVVTGTSYSDTIYNYADTVTVQALGGDDSIYGSDDLRDSIVISGGAGNDDIEGRYANSSISGDAGNDVIIINVAIFDTILGGAGNDTIGVNQIFYSSIDGGAENDTFVVIGYGNTISGGTGNDSIINGYESIDSSLGDYVGNTFVYSSGDGNDVIYNFSALDTLQIGGGYGTYSTQTSGSDLIVTVGDGKITLQGAANLSAVNINGTNNNTPIWRINGATATYGTASNTLITVTGVKSTDGLNLNGSTVTVANSALNGSNVTVSNGYYLALANDVPIISTTAAGWTFNGTTATYKAASTSAGYALNNNQITYTAAGGGNALVNVTGVKSTDGLNLNGSTVTVANSALNGSNVTVSNGYYLALANDVPITSTTAAGWTLNGTTATYKAATTSAGYTLANNQITYTAAGGGNALVNVTGVKSTDGLNLNGSTVTVANAALNGSNVTVSNGYYLALANDVPITSTTAAGWTLNGTTATYKAATTSAGYTLANNQITYTAASGGNALVNVTGVKSTDGLNLNGSTVTVANSALNGSNVTVSNGYYLALANDVPITSTTAAGWTLNGTTATYKAAATSAGYTLANNQITYTAAGGGNALVNVTGVKSTDGLNLNGSTVTVANSALNGSNVTVSNGYYLALANDVTITSTTAAGWTLNGTTATYKAAATSAGYTLANNQITYTAAGGGNNLITVNGVNSTNGLDVNGNIVKVASSALNQGTVSINDGYILALGDDVTAPKTTAAGWTLNGSVAIYKTASTTAGYSLVNNQIVYTAASGGDTLATISGVKSTNGLSLNGNVITLSAAALGSNNVSVSNGYTLNLANDVPLSQTTAAGWTLDGTTAKYKSMSTTAGYTLNNNQVIYTAASGGENLVSVKGVKSTKGLTLNGNVVTVAKSSVNNEKITIDGGYTLALASDVSKPETKKAAWTKISNSSSTYKSSYKTAGYTLASNAKSISYSSATAAKELATVKGIKSTSGLSVSGKKITVSKASLNAKKVTISGDGYKLALGSDVTKSKTSKAWSLSKSTATYKQSTTTGYALADNAINYTKKATSTTLATVKGAKSKSGLKVSGQKITLKNSALSKKVTVSGGYEFDFQSDYKSATITGSSSADTITARGSKISVNGGKGDDTIKIIGSGTVTGGNGADVFYYKSTGANVISDYAANDKISIASGTAKVTTSGSDVVFTVGKGKITVTGGVDKTITYIEKGEEKTHKGIAEYLNFASKGTAVTLKAGYTAGNFTPSEYSNYKDVLVTIDASKVKNPLTITGNKKSNVIIGSGDDDYISGELGADKISGGDGNDTLIGGAGNDKLYGGKGDDSLWGGAGTDTLFGDDGSDTFVYKKGDGKMIIADFEGEKIDTIMVLSDKVDGYSADSSNIIFNLHSGGQIVVQGGADKSINVVDKNGNSLRHYNPTK